MSKHQIKLAVLAVLAVTASAFVSAPPTLAQTDRAAPPIEAVPDLPQPEAFVPAPPVLTAADSVLLNEPPESGSSSLTQPVAEVVPSEETTATSRISVDAEGKGTAEYFAEPAFRRKGGRWVEVDSKLRSTGSAETPVAAERALRPVRFGTRANRIVELGLDRGPVTLSAPGLNLRKPVLDGDSVVYRGVARDTDLRYVVGDDGVKEELVLHSAAAPRSFTFHLADPAGQLGAPTRDETGAWTFPIPIEEGVRLSLPPALAWEAGTEGEPVAADPASANLELVPAGDGWDLTVSVAEAWLADKTFPVVLDPTLSYSANYGDGPTLEGYAIRHDGSCEGSCFLTRDSYLYAGSWAPYNPVRSYVRYDLSDIPDDARIDSATFRIYNSGCMVVRSPDPCASKSHYIGLHRMLDNWYSSSRYDELAADTAASPFTPWIQRAAGASPSYHFWTDGLTDQVQRWVNGSQPNFGFAIRSLNESSNQAGPAYLSSRHSTTSRRPSLSVSYTVVAPGSPGVAAFAGNGAARVHWGIPNSGGAAITSYLIKTYRSGTEVASKTVTCPCPTVTAVEGLANGTTYSFTVQARNSVGYSSPATSGSVTPSAALPTAPSPAAATAGWGGATATWRHPSTGAADAYVVQAYDPEVGYVGEVVRSCPCATIEGVPGLSNTKPYILGVYAYNEAGYSVPSLTSVVTPSSSRPLPPREASATVVSPGTLEVSWLAPSGGSTSGYRIVPYDSLSGEVAGKVKTLACPCSSLRATIDGLAPGRTFLMSVQATNSTGSGLPSISGPATLPDVPSAPTSLAAVPGDAAAALSWNASAPNGSPVTGYTLTASPGGATTAVAGDATSAMFEGLTNGTAYTFTAVATNVVGDSAASLPSNEVTPQSDSSLLAPLVAATNVVATRGDTQAHVTWTRPTLTLPLLTTFDVTTYRAADGTELGTTSAGTGSSVTVTGLKNGTPVYFTVTARSLLIATTSERSNTITPAGPPFAPADVTAIRGDGKVDLTWRPPDPRPDGTPGDNGDPITSYTVTAFRADNNAEVRTIEGAVSPLEIGDLTNGTTYYFKVRATNGVGTGPDSPSSNYVTPAGRPFPPTDVTASLGAPGEAEVSWTAPNDNGSPITSYTVVASDGGASETVPAPLTSATVRGLQEGTSYTFTVVATNDVGDSEPSAASNELTVARPPSTPTNVSAAPRDGAAVVRWDASDPNGAAVTYTVVASPGGATRSTMATSTVVGGLTNGVEYTFTVRASNIAGDSAVSPSSNPVTPQAAPPPAEPSPPPPDDPCQSSSLPEPPGEVRLENGALQRQIIVPCFAGFGQVRMGFFIMDEELKLTPVGPVIADGDDRSFDPNMTPPDNRIYLEIDYRTGTGFIEVNRSCPDRTETDCEPARSIVDSFDSYVRSDGSLNIKFSIGNSLYADTFGVNNAEISADVDILPVRGGGVCLLGAVSHFPSAEAYYDIDGSIDTIYNLEQSDAGGFALGFPDRSLPASACETTEMPPFGEPTPGETA